MSTLLPINLVSNAQELLTLTSQACPVDVMTNELDQFVDDMIHTAVNSPGCIGLAANQVWRHLELPVPAIAVLRGNDAGSWKTVINPVIIHQHKKIVDAEEMCMSIPHYSAVISRPKHIIVSYYGKNLQFFKHEHLFDLSARIFLHEYDHLQGKLINGSAPRS